jgi:hypothetical protein
MLIGVFGSGFLGSVLFVDPSVCHVQNLGCDEEIIAAEV